MCEHEQTNFENVEHLLNFAHAKNGEVYIYNEDDRDVRLASCVAYYCPKEFSADDILNGECSECMPLCAAGVLNFCAIQAAELREKLIRQEKERLAEQEAYGKRVARDIFERLIERESGIVREYLNRERFLCGLGVEDLKQMAKEYGVNLDKQADKQGDVEK